MTRRPSFDAVRRRLRGGRWTSTRTPGRRVRVFLSYRQHGGVFETLWLAQRLRARYGVDRVFRDVESFRTGDDLDARISDAIAKACVVAVVTPTWVEQLKVRDRASDWVRREMLLAHAQPGPVHFVCLGRGPLVAEDGLPADLEWMVEASRLQAVAPDPNALATAVDQLIRGLDGDRRVGWWDHRRHRLATWATAGALAGLGAFLLRPMPTPGLPDVGLQQGFQLVVTPFAETTAGAGPGRATRVGEQLAASVAAVFDDTSVPGHRNVTLVDPHFTITAAAPAEREQVAARLLERSGADVLLAGTVRRHANRTTLTLEAYLGRSESLTAPELVGRRLLTLTSEVFIDIGDSKRVRERMARRVGEQLGELTPFFDGLAASSEHDAARMIDDFEPILSAPASKLPPTTIAVMHQLIGNAHATAREWTPAAQSYRDALAADPTFERAGLGLAELPFLAGSGGCSARGADLGQLRQAASLYGTIVASTAQETIKLEAAVGRARALACEGTASRAGDAPLIDAIGLLRGLRTSHLRDHRAQSETVAEGAIVVAHLLDVASGDLAGHGQLVEYLVSIDMVAEPTRAMLVAGAEAWYGFAAERSRDPYRLSTAMLGQAAMLDAGEHHVQAEQVRTDALGRLEGEMDCDPAACPADPLGLALVLGRIGDLRESLRVESDAAFSRAFAAAAGVDRLQEPLLACRQSTANDRWHCAVAIIDASR